MQLAGCAGSGRYTGQRRRMTCQPQHQVSGQAGSRDGHMARFAFDALGNRADRGPTGHSANKQTKKSRTREKILAAAGIGAAMIAGALPGAGMASATDGYDQVSIHDVRELDRHQLPVLVGPRHLRHGRQFHRRGHHGGAHEAQRPRRTASIAIRTLLASGDVLGRAGGHRRRRPPTTSAPAPPPEPVFTPGPDRVGDTAPQGLTGFHAVTPQRPRSC